MKKLLIHVFIFSIFVYCVLAADANLYEAQDFTKHPEQLAILAERDMIRINWEGKEHQIHVRKIYYPEKKKVDLTAFIEGSEVPYYTTITPKTSLQLDFNRDDVYDLKVSIFNLLEEDGKKFVALKLEKLVQEPTTSITAEAVAKQDNKFYQFLSQKVYIIAGPIVLSILGLIIWKKGFFTKKKTK